MKQISVFITNSLGEVDVLLPLFSNMRDSEIKLIFHSDTMNNSKKMNFIICV